jgi:hypothetical protein
MYAKALVPLALLCLSSGCMVMHGGFTRDSLQMRLREEADEDKHKTTESDIARIQTLKPQLRFPCRIAVALRAERGPWRWTAKDRQQMESWADALRKEGIASDVVFMSSMFMKGESQHELRAAAARYGADAVLLVSGTSADGEWKNPLALLDLTVVGGFVLPATHREAMYRVEAALMDVNNGFLYASAEAEGEAASIGPTFIHDAREAVDHAKQSALSAFGPELLTRMRNLRTAAQAAPPQTLVGH